MIVGHKKAWSRRARLGLLLIPVGVFALAKGATLMEKLLTKKDVTAVLDRHVGSKVPGIQYVVVDAEGTIFEYAGGWADIRERRPMTLDTTLMAYSMTKTFTAVAVLQLVEQERLGLDDEIDRHLPDTPYRDRHITIRQLLEHTSGIPNPIPLRWAHLTADDASFDEDAALARVLGGNPKLSSEPGRKYAYSNIGYWLLGKVVERVTGASYANYVRANILTPLGLSGREVDFVIPNPEGHANGYLARYSLMNLAKGFVMDKKFWSSYEGDWLRFRSHHLDGPAFGGLVGSAGSFARFLQDQLRAESVLMGEGTKRLLETQGEDLAGKAIPMTPGWHVGRTDGVTYLFKEGGGGGFHSEMRLYPEHGMASVVMVNGTEFNSTKFLNRLDGAFLP